MTERQSVTVRVPATTANLGPAYDVLGLALDLWMDVTVSRAEKFSLEIEGEGAGNIELNEDNRIVTATRRGFELAGKELVPCAYKISSGVPFKCGCGSSSAVATAGVLAGLALCGHTLACTEGEKLLKAVSEIEGHPDNAAPAIYGGLQLGYQNKDGFATLRVPMPPNLWCVMFVPDKEMKPDTNFTRKLIPETVSMADAIHNMSRTALIVASLASGDLSKLNDAADDRFHQPPRRHLFPHMDPTIAAAQQAGASYAFLSGAGPTICAFVQGKSGETLVQAEKERLGQTVAVAMLKAAQAAGISGRCFVTSPSQKGAHIVSDSLVLRL